jgi:hypothetical protein
MTPQTKNATTTAAKIQNSAMSLMLVSLGAGIIISVIAVGTAFPNIGHRIITLATTRPKILFRKRPSCSISTGEHASIGHGSSAPITSAGRFSPLGPISASPVARKQSVIFV